MASRLLQLLALWTIVISIVQCCPELCSCQDKFAHQFADCAYKDLLVVPVGLPSNVSTVSLSANKIKLLKSKSFINITQVTSLWLAHNEIITIETNTLAPLIRLRNLDISYNKIVNFPWEDLHNLTALQLLKMNNNEMVNLPKDAFFTLRNLRSLRINNNKFTTIVQGTFNALTSMSHLQIFNNPFTCSCSLEWLRDWIATTKISVLEPTSILCDAPEHLKGMMVTNIPKLDCEVPAVTITHKPNIPKQNYAAPCLTDQKTPQDPKSQPLAAGLSTCLSLLLGNISSTEQTSVGLPQRSNLDDLKGHGEESINQRNEDKDKPPSTLTPTRFWKSNPATNSPEKPCGSEVSDILLSIDEKLSALDARMAVIEGLHNEFKGLHESLEFIRAQQTIITNENKLLQQSITTLITQLTTVPEENKIMKKTLLAVQ